MKNPAVSVIIPTLNEEKNLPMCLKSLKNQKTKYKFEILIADYKSKDKTRHIARKMGAKVIPINEEGRAAARNKAAEIARGEILAFTEADCIVNPNWIDLIAGYLGKNPKTIGLSGIYSFYESSFFYNFLAGIVLNTNEFLYNIFFGNHSFRGTNMIVRKSILNKMGGFRYGAAPADDFDLGLRLRRMGPIDFLSDLKIMTSDRRIKGRILKFVKEFFLTYSRVFIFKKRGFDTSYEIIR